MIWGRRGENRDESLAVQQEVSLLLFKEEENNGKSETKYSEKIPLHILSEGYWDLWCTFHELVKSAVFGRIFPSESEYWARIKQASLLRKTSFGQRGPNVLSDVLISFLNILAPLLH